MLKVVDARNLACPQPVVLTIEALKEADEVVTVVDNDVARDNVFQLGKSRGCEVTVEPKEDGIYLTLRKMGAVATEQTPGAIIEEAPGAAISTVLFIASDLLGRGENQQLGNLLMQMFLHTLGSLTSRPETIILINNGVKLATNGSLVVEELRRLEDMGIEILACGTCLSRLQLADKVAVGQVSNMYVIAETLLRAQKSISL